METNGPTNGSASTDDTLEARPGSNRVLAAALHGGHQLRREVSRHIALDEAARRREEDPCTDVWARAFPARVIAQRSRFEVDLNRPPDAAVYTNPDAAWGLEVWSTPPPEKLVERSLQLHRTFYAHMHELVAGLVRRWGRLLVLDLHSYNHRRGGPEAPPDDPTVRPDINIGTGSMDRGRWGEVVDRFMGTLREPVGGPPLDVRENACFRGGYFPSWLHATFPGHVCAIAVEVKKTYMNEWSGRVLASPTHRVGRLLRTAGLQAAAALPSSAPAAVRIGR